MGEQQQKSQFFGINTTITIKEQSGLLYFSEAKQISVFFPGGGGAELLAVLALLIKEQEKAGFCGSSFRFVFFGCKTALRKERKGRIRPPTAWLKNRAQIYSLQKKTAGAVKKNSGIKKKQRLTNQFFFCCPGFDLLVVKL